MMVESYIVRLNLLEGAGARFEEIDIRREELLKNIDTTNKQQCIDFGMQLSSEFEEIENFRLDVEYLRIEKLNAVTRKK